MDAERLRRIERTRLQALVEGSTADELHAADFRIVTPSGQPWSREEYLGGIASGDINYHRFEPTSEIEVILDHDLAVLRYRSAITISVNGQQPGDLQAWHLDVYRRTPDGWQIQWSQATAIT